ncbi:MAG: NUDIX domain-containing protein [Propionibacteriales bacterium]|nr:NUDIX domain-containing protein [Propionibacteriales bacterium]
MELTHGVFAYPVRRSCVRLTAVSEHAPPEVVVGAAIIMQGRLLAARRTSPAETAGGWEFPGGKVRPDETPEAACVREVREELACEIEVVSRLAGEEPLNPGYVLHVYEARIVSGEPVPSEHDAIRWLGPDELEDVAWLDADRPFLRPLHERLRAQP